MFIPKKAFVLVLASGIRFNYKKSPMMLPTSKDHVNSLLAIAN